MSCSVWRQYKTSSKKEANHTSNPRRLLIMAARQIEQPMRSLCKDYCFMVFRLCPMRRRKRISCSCQPASYKPPFGDAAPIISWWMQQRYGSVRLQFIISPMVKGHLEKVPVKHCRWILSMFWWYFDCCLVISLLFLVKISLFPTKIFTDMVKISPEIFTGTNLTAP